MAGNMLGDIGIPDNYGTTVLHLVADSDSTTALGFLLDMGSDGNAPDSDQETALHWAAKRGYVDMVQNLLWCGANPNARTASLGRTQLHFIPLNSPEGFKKLVEHGAEASARDATGCSLIDTGCVILDGERSLPIGNFLSERTERKSEVIING
jgi:ankyrin repeat protein